MHRRSLWSSPEVCANELDCDPWRFRTSPGHGTRRFSPDLTRCRCTRWTGVGSTMRSYSLNAKGNLDGR